MACAKMVLSLKKYNIFATGENLVVLIDFKNFILPSYLKYMIFKQWLSLAR